MVSPGVFPFDNNNSILRYFKQKHFIYWAISSTPELFLIKLCFFFKKERKETPTHGPVETSNECPYKLVSEQKKSGQPFSFPHMPLEGQQANEKYFLQGFPRGHGVRDWMALWEMALGRHFDLGVTSDALAKQVWWGQDLRHKSR